MAFNCVANGILLREKIFDNIWIQHAASDAKGALSAALSIWYLHHNKQRFLTKGRDALKGAYLGPKFSNVEIETEFKACGAVCQKCSEEKLIDAVVAALIYENAIGWMQGRMEFGPQAAGARSIIVDPRSPMMQKKA